MWDEAAFIKLLLFFIIQGEYIIPAMASSKRLPPRGLKQSIYVAKIATKGRLLKLVGAIRALYAFLRQCIIYLFEEGMNQCDHPDY